MPFHFKGHARQFAALLICEFVVSFFDVMNKLYNVLKENKQNCVKRMVDSEFVKTLYERYDNISMNH